jgi:hypothetical protein
MRLEDEFSADYADYAEESSGTVQFMERSQITLP